MANWYKKAISLNLGLEEVITFFEKNNTLDELITNLVNYHLSKLDLDQRIGILEGTKFTELVIDFIYKKYFPTIHELSDSEIDKLYEYLEKEIGSRLKLIIEEDKKDLASTPKEKGIARQLSESKIVDYVILDLLRNQDKIYSLRPEDILAYVKHKIKEVIKSDGITLYVEELSPEELDLFIMKTLYKYV